MHLRTHPSRAQRLRRHDPGDIAAIAIAAWWATIACGALGGLALVCLRLVFQG
jgi:hypothetical protein